jgi:hypothetical protein
MAHFYFHTCDYCGYQVETSGKWPLSRKINGIEKYWGAYATLYCPVCDEVFRDVLISDKEKSPELSWWVNCALNYLPLERHDEIYHQDHYFRKENKKPVLCPRCSRVTLVLEGVGKDCCEFQCPRCQEGRMTTRISGHVKFGPTG